MTEAKKEEQSVIEPYVENLADLASSMSELSTKRRKTALKRVIGTAMTVAYNLGVERGMQKIINVMSAVPPKITTSKDDNN